AREANVVARGMEVGAHEAEHVRIVVDDERGRGALDGTRRRRDLCLPRAGWSIAMRVPGELEGEGGAGARLAGDEDLPAEHLREAAAEREPEPGAAVLSRGGFVGLGEVLEEA